MRATFVLLGMFVGCAAVSLLATPARSALTSEQQKELRDVSRDLRSLSSLVRRKKFDEAEKSLGEIQAAIDKLAAGNEKERQILLIKKQLDIQRKLLERAKSPDKRRPGKEPQVSFNKHVAPILKARCGNCHIERASGGLQFDTFANLAKGGRSGAAVVAQTPAQSPLLLRLVAQGNQRMPRGGNPLPAAEIQVIQAWIALGAEFDGQDRNSPIGEVATTSTPGGNAPAIAKATGKETVSFIRDVAPFVVNLCTRCHGGNDPRGGLSVVSFEDLMKGGNSGRVLLPGNLDGSILWQRVGTPQPPDKRMPQGQARITRTHHANLKKWIEEGCKFDGADAKAPLRGQVPTEDQLIAEKLAKLTPEEFEKHRLDRSNELWDAAFTSERPQYIEGKEVLVYGNAGAERMQIVYDWAEEHVKQLRSTFNVKEDRVWKGRLTIYVIKDRFGYEEFNVVNNNRQQVPREMVGHSVVTVAMNDAYVVLQDVGDDVTAENAGMKFNLIDHVTGAFLKRTGGALPEWVVRGTGVYMAARQDTENLHVKEMRAGVPDMLSSLAKPEDIFNDGTFSPSAVGAVGYALVEFMTKNGGVPKYDGFVRSLQGGNNVTAAMKSVYQADPQAVSVAFIRSYQK